MLCPVCAVELQMTDRQGIEIDYCPRCRGVWLDRGELDKILERSASEMSRPAEAPPPAAGRGPEPPSEPYREREEYRERDRYERRYDDDDYRRKDKKKRMKHWLEELFD